VISRTGMKARGVPPSTADFWYRNRSRTGHPDKAGRIGRTDYWYEDEWVGWYQAHLEARTGSLTRVDRQGDPDDLVDATEAARVMGYANRSVVTANRRLGYFPQPDTYGPAPRGRPSPLWKRSTVWAFADGRPGQGGGGGRTSGTGGIPVKPHWYAGDPRLDRVLTGLRSGAQPSSAQLAAEWRVSRRTAERIIRVARALLED
jgi:hypothetical protein